MGKHLEKIKPRIYTDCTRINEIRLGRQIEAIIGSAYEVHNIPDVVF